MFLLFALIRMKARSEEIEQIVCGFGFGVGGFWWVWVWVWVWVWEAGVLSLQHEWYGSIRSFVF